VETYRKLIQQEDPDGRLAKTKEEAIIRLGELYAKQGKGKELQSLVQEIRPYFRTIPKSRVGKIVRQLIELVALIPNSQKLQIELCEEAIDWCIKEKRTLVKQRIQARLANLLLETQRYKESLQLITALAKEVRKTDVKLLLVEICLIESRVHVALQNIPAAKGALTSGRSAANSIYCPPELQAEIDLQAGTLGAHENDYKIGFSYFYEAFEGYNTINQAAKAQQCLKYMLLSKILLNQPEVLSFVE